MKRNFMAEWKERLFRHTDRVALAAGLSRRLAHCRPSSRIGHCVAGGDEIPGGDEKRIPGGVGILFSHRGEKDPRQAEIVWGSGRDTNIGTGFVCRGAGCASRRQGKRDGTRCFTGKTSGIRAERNGNGTGSNWDAKRQQAQSAPRTKDADLTTKSRRHSGKLNLSR